MSDQDCLKTRARIAWTLVTALIFASVIVVPQAAFANRGGDESRPGKECVVYPLRRVLAMRYSEVRKLLHRVAPARVKFNIVGYNSIVSGAILQLLASDRVDAVALMNKVRFAKDEKQIRKHLIAALAAKTRVRDKLTAEYSSTKARYLKGQVPDGVKRLVGYIELNFVEDASALENLARTNGVPRHWLSRLEELRVIHSVRKMVENYMRGLRIMQTYLDHKDSDLCE